MKKILYLSMALCIIIFCSICFDTAFAEDNESMITTGTNFSAGTSKISDEEQKESELSKDKDAKKEEIKIIEKKAQETKEILKEKEETIESVKKEVEEINKEKEKIEKEAVAKETAAQIANEKLENLKKEAESTKDREAMRKAQQLKEEAKRLEDEADLHKEKLKLTERKSTEAQKKVDVHQESIEALRKELQALKTMRATKRSFLEKSIMSVTIIFIGIILFILIKLGIKQFERLITRTDQIREDETILRMKTLSKLFSWLGNIVIMCVVFYMVLESFGFNVAPLLAGAGIIGLAFGFGGQYLIRDLINGLFILIEGQYRINDVIKIGEYGGLVEDINLRITTLRDLEGRVIIIPNGEIKTVVNYTKDYAQALLNIGVAYKENVDRVMDIIKAVGEEMRGDEYFGRLILNDLEMLGVDDFANSAVIIKFRMKTLPIKQWEVMREFRRRLKNKFDELGIEIPFPHRTIYWGTGKDNEWVKNYADQVVHKK
ncbi:mechanosensitive ion channel domain-containing protein [Candidatus Omnitrophota bacterium]